MPSSEMNARFLALIGYGDDYGSEEARLALAISDAGGGGGGGGTSAGTIASGIDLSSDIEEIKDSLAVIEVNTSPSAGAYSEISGAVITSAATVKPASATRTFFSIQNVGTVQNLWVRFGTAASVGSSFKILPGGSLQSDIPQQIQQSISIISEGSGTNYFGFTIE